ncbi:MAG TPA: OpgC domain-containing protein [Anaerolineae bacterium]
MRTENRRALAIAQTLTHVWALPRSISLDWSYAALDKRDLRLDLLRGFAVMVMVIDHFGGSSWLYLITGGNNFFVSGAEAFVFISGFVVGMVYGGIALKQGLKTAQIKALQRALTLYKLTVILTLVFAGLSRFFGLEWAKGLSIESMLQFVVDVATLRQTMYLADIPMMYTYLMLAAAGGLWLLYTRRTVWLLVGSSALWLAFQLCQIQIPWTIAGNTTFNLAAWQFLFFVAMSVGYHRESLAGRLSQLPRRSYFMLSALVLVWFAQVYATNGSALAQWIPSSDAGALMSELFNKSAVAPGRLAASFVVFQFAYLAVTLFWKPIWAAFGWLLMPLGQNSLYSYTMHVVVIGAFYAALPYLPGHITSIGTINTSLQLMAILLLWAMIQRQFMFRIIPR